MLICGIELFVFTEKSQLYSYTVDLSQEWFRFLAFLQFYFAVQVSRGSHPAAVGDLLRCQWITVVNGSCVYRKVSQVLESI